MCNIILKNKRVLMTFCILILLIADPIKVQSEGVTKVYSGVTVNPNPITVGQNFQVTFSIREVNGEALTIAEMTCAILDANNNHLFNLDVKTNVSVPANGTYTYTASGYTHSGYLNNPGTYKAMARGRVGVSWFDWWTMDAGVNPRTFQVVAVSPNLVAIDAYITLLGSPATKLTRDPTIGEQIQFGLDYRLDGANINTPFKIKAYLDNQQMWEQTYTNMQTGNKYLDPTIVGVTWTATAGSHTLRWKVDADNQITESNENDNEKTRSWYTQQQFDLIRGIVEFKNINGNPITGNVGEQVYFHFKYSIVGQGTTPSFNIQCKLNGSAYDTKTNVTGVGGQNYEIRATNPFTATAASINVEWILDVNNNITESNETNNTASGGYTPWQFTLLEPTPNATITTNEIKFKWSNVSATRYELYVDNNSGSMGSAEISPQHIDALKNLTATEFTICANWLCQGNYFWKVKAFLSNGSTIESSVATFQSLPPTAASPQWEPLRRLYHSVDKDHFYCTSEGHKKVAEGSGYKDERVEGYVSIQRFNASDVVNIFRFYDGSKDCHYYTTDENDKDLKIIAGLTYEGITGFAYKNAHEGLAKLYHLKKEFSATNHDHFYTISEFEKDNAQTQYGFLYQGITAYISPNGKDTPIPIHAAQMILGDGINPHNGNFNHYTETSFQIPGIGLPLVFAHTYNSLSAHLTRAFLPFTPLGPGWSHSYNSYIVFLENQIAIHWPDGTIDIYNKSGSAYVPKLKSVYDEITVISTTSFQIKKRDQTVYTYQRPAVAPNWYPAMLISVKDRNGNAITCQYESGGQMRLISVTEPSGRKLLISYNTTSGKEHLISQVTDPLNRMIRFEYDGYENLSKFTNAENKITEYQYDPINILDHLLTSIKRPKGNIITNEFANRIISKQQVSGYGPLQITYFTDRTNITDAAGVKIDVYNSVRDEIVIPDRIVDGSNHDIDPT